MSYATVLTYDSADDHNWKEKDANGFVNESFISIGPSFVAASWYNPQKSSSEIESEYFLQ